MTIPDPTPIEPEPEPLDPDVTGGPTGPIDQSESEIDAGHRSNLPLKRSAINLGGFR